MINDTVKRIEETILKIESVDSEKRTELLGLLAALKAEVSRLGETHEEHASSIAGYAAVAAHEATRKKRSAGLLQHSLDGLSLSVQGFETSHPELVDVVNDICVMLARIGI